MIQLGGGAPKGKMCIQFLHFLAFFTCFPFIAFNSALKKGEFASSSSITMKDQKQLL